MRLFISLEEPLVLGGRFRVPDGPVDLTADESVEKIGLCEA